jgi:integrase
MPVHKDTKRPGYWRIVVWSHGRSHEHREKGGTRKQWEAFERRWKLDLDASGPAPERPKGEAAPTLLTFSSGPYASHAAAHLGERTRAVRVFQLANLCRLMGARKLPEFTTQVLERYQADRLAEGAKPGTVNTETAKLLAVLSYARSIGEPAASPKVKLLPVRGRGRVKAWTKKEVRHLLAVAERDFPELLPLVLFLAYTGCRKGEAIAALTSWVDLDADVLRIEPNEDWQPKDGEPREVPIEPALRPWLERAVKSGRCHVFAPTLRKAKGQPRERFAFFPRRRFEEAMRAAGLTGSPHKLRHTYASLFLAAGGSMFALSRILGHASIRTTERCYAHMLPEALDAARGLVNLGRVVGPAKLEARKRWRA